MTSLVQRMVSEMRSLYMCCQDMGEGWGGHKVIPSFGFSGYKNYP
jgi:hypothetical protein